MTNSPSVYLKDLAIDIFIESSGFDSAYSNGTDYLIPHAAYFNEEDLRKIFTGSLNNRNWNSTNSKGQQPKCRHIAKRHNDSWANAGKICGCRQQHSAGNF